MALAAKPSEARVEKGCSDVKKAEKGGKPSLEQLEKEVEELRKALNEERDKAEKHVTQLKYLQADYENFRKRIFKEVDEMVSSRKEGLILELLTVIDELELAVQAGKETENKEALMKGLDMVLKKFYETLSAEGLTRIEAVGKVFNPEEHEAVERVPSKNHKEGTVIAETRKGFTLKGRVIRPSMVKVALNPPCSTTVQLEEGGGGEAR